MNQADLTKQIIQDLSNLRMQKPLILSLTNYVAMNNTANALLALGASPIMAHSSEGMSEIMAIAHAVVINIGTLDSLRIQQMQIAIEQANIHQKIVILDPVGCGASKLRTQVSREFCESADKLIIRANASEIMALANLTSQIKGVDSLDASDNAIHAAKNLISQYGAIEVIISGEHDYSVTSKRMIKLSNGHTMMPRVTGMGCTHTALTAAFAAVTPSNAGVCSTAILGICGEMSAMISNGPGSLQMNLLDQLYLISAEDIEKRIRIKYLDRSD